MTSDNTSHSIVPSAEPAIFSAVITPHRSLGSRGFLILMLAIGAVSFVSGMVFLLLGAWPVFGFLGLDVLLVYVAFRANYRAARAYEEVDRDFDRADLAQGQSPRTGAAMDA